mmetsp:Transcript_31105/g.55694  ORF Transcript_31105/g.55694 Transcript_31105/m.55694 type:complete len:279 (-) Transcript_31105:320-1156(-)
MGESLSKGYYFQQDVQEVPRTPPHTPTPVCGGSPWSMESDVTTPMWSAATGVDTVIIFDWDDTLLCSSAINNQSWSPQQLQQLERAVETILHTAMALGETMIVTNGNATWVQDSTRRFFPGLAKTLSRLTVISARASFESSFPGDPFAWKRQCFKEILARRRQEGGNYLGGVNLVVLGDSPAEIEAAQSAVKVLHGKSVVKTLKFKEAPTVNELLGQLRRVLQELGSLVSEERAGNKTLVPRSFPAHLDHLSSWASGWRISEQECADSLFESVLSRRW